MIEVVLKTIFKCLVLIQCRAAGLIVLESRSRFFPLWELISKWHQVYQNNHSYFLPLNKWPHDVTPREADQKRKVRTQWEKSCVWENKRRRKVRWSDDESNWPHWACTENKFTFCGVDVSMKASIRLIAGGVLQGDPTHLYNHLKIKFLFYSCATACLQCYDCINSICYFQSHNIWTASYNWVHTSCGGNMD